MSEKSIQRIGWIASFLAIAMYFSFIDQIRLNMQGNHGSVLLPTITSINCAVWILYGSSKSQKDWPLIACNIPGVILGVISAITAVA